MWPSYAGGRRGVWRELGWQDGETYGGGARECPHVEEAEKMARWANGLGTGAHKQESEGCLKVWRSLVEELPGCAREDRWGAWYSDPRGRYHPRSTR